MADPSKPRWGLRAQKGAALAETTVPDETAPAPEASAEGEELGVEAPGHYILKREIGRGAQAVVFVATDRQVGREVAFKQLLKGGPRNAEERFLREARVAGQLEHPGVAAVYEVGRREDGSLYSVMRLVRGKTLAEALVEAKGLRARLALISHFVQLCQTLAYAHERGVVHRDVKPENVMLGAYGETVLLDWGVAKVKGKADLYGDRLRAPDINDRFDGKTEEGDVVGTPAYMSPEQALGNVNAIDEQSDVWSLGAVLYELLTGKRPFEQKNAVQLLLAIAKDKIPAVRAVEPEVPRELALICERCLERNKARRYKSAKEVAADVEAYRAGLRVSGVQYNPLQLARKWVLRNLPLTIAIAVAALLLGGAVARIWAENRAARGYLAEALLEKSDAAARDQLWLRAAAYAAAARVQDDTAEARFRAAQMGPLRVEPVWRVELPSSVERLAVSPDGRLIAAGLSDRAIVLLDQTGHEKRRIEGHEAPLTALAFSPDGATLISASDDKNVFVWSTDAGERIGQLDSMKVRDLAFSSDGTKLAVAGADGLIHLVGADGWQTRAKLAGHDGAVTSVAFQPDGDGLLSTGEDGTLRLWTALAARTPQMRLVRGEGHQPVNRGAFVSATTVASASQDGTVRFFSLEGAQLARINLTHGSMVGLAAPAHGAIAALGQDNVAVLIDPQTHAQVARLEGDDTASAIAISADGASLVSANRDGKVRLWKLSEGAHEARLQMPGEFTGGTALAFSPGGGRVALGDAAGHISLWDVQRAKIISGMDLLQGPVSAIAFSADGSKLAVAGHEEQAFVFELTHGDRTALEGHTDLTSAITFSPDGATIVTGSNDGTVRLWQAANGASRRVLSAPGMGPVLAVAVSPDGKLIASGGEDKTVRLWDASSGRLLHKMEGSPDAVLALAFSPHGSLVVSSGRDQAIRAWRTKNGKLRSLFTGHGGRVWSLSFAPDGETLASASIDGTIRLWDMLTGREEARFERTPEARAVAFSPDGRALASTGPKPALQLLDLGDKTLLAPPRPELSTQLAKARLRLEGLRLVDDLDALTPARHGR